EMDGRQGHLLAAWKLHRPLRPARVQAQQHPARALSQPEHRGHHHQFPRRQARRGGDLGADRFQAGDGRHPPAAPRGRDFAASGEDFDALDGGMLIMLNDLIQQRPDIVRAWLEAELDAQLFIADPKNAVDVVKMAEQQTEKMPARALWASLYGAYPKEVGGG